MFQVDGKNKHQTVNKNEMLNCELAKSKKGGNLKFLITMWVKKRIE